MSAIDRVYSRAAEISGLAKELTADMGDVSTEFGNILGLTAGADDAPVVKLLNTVFEEALKMRACDGMDVSCFSDVNRNSARL